MTPIPRYALLLSLLLGFLCVPSPGVGQTPATPAVVFRDCDVCPEMVVVPGGTFTMGSPQRGKDVVYTEWPRHKVTITRFAVGRYEVTNAEWGVCYADGGCPHDGLGLGLGPTGRDHPVQFVNWHDAKKYVAWLSRKTGKTYRLLTEAEWEYAARAGTRTAYYWGREVGSGNAYNREGLIDTVPVGSYAPNAFGLYDTSGNVSEWVEDCWHENYEGAPTDGSAWGSEDGGYCDNRVLRGGHSLYLPARSASRSQHFSDAATHGLRVARALD